VPPVMRRILSLKIDMINYVIYIFHKNIYAKLILFNPF